MIIDHDYQFISAVKKENNTKVKFLNECLGRHGQSQLSVYVFSVCHNEINILPHFINHYKDIASKIIIKDGGSTDGSIEFLKQYCPLVEIIEERDEKLDDMKLMLYRNEYWKQYKEDADFIIVCDVDELLYSPNLLEKLKNYKNNGIMVPRVKGYNLVSDYLPKNTNEKIYNMVKSGIPDPEHLNKFIIFNPKTDIHYEPGCHKANFKNNPTFSQDYLKLLHLKYVGYQEFIEKAQRNSQRLSDINKQNNWGFHYNLEKNTTKEQFLQLLNKCDNVVDDNDNEMPLLYNQTLKIQHDSVFREVIEQNQYKISRKDVQGKNIIDIGSNNGLFTLLSSIWKANKIIAIESNPKTFELLKNNTQNDNKIITINKAVLDKTGIKLKNIKENGFCDIDGRTYVLPDNNGEIESISLNDIIKEYFDDDNDILLKMDCEGSEYKILFGADISLLRKCKTILIEAHEDILGLKEKKGLINQLKNYLESIGYVEKWHSNVVENKVILFRFDLEKELDNDISVVISTYLKPELINRQIEHFKNQTLKPKEIIVWQTKPNKDFQLNIEDKDVKVITTDNNFGINSRFSIPLMLNSNYVFVTDDDVFPGNKWLEEAYRLSKIHNSVISPYGIDYKDKNYNDMNSNRYGDHGIRNVIEKKVDVGGHGFFGRREWFKLFWREDPIDNSISDDIHMSCMLQKYSDVNIYVSPYPEDNKDIWGNVDINAGMGFRALHTRKWEDEEIWKDVNKISWNEKDISYLSNNLNEFCKKREEIIKKYVDNLNNVALEKKIENNKKLPDVTVIVPTRNRHFTTLPLTLISIINQTIKPKDVFIIDDSDKKIKIIDIPLYQYIFNLFKLNNIYWEYNFTAIPGKGQHISHQFGKNRAKTQFILRIDDDEILEYNTLEILLNSIKEDTGAVGGLVLDPNQTNYAPEGYQNFNKIEDIDSRENTQWLIHPPGNVFEVQHLYSTFLYRNLPEIGYCMELSPSAHREESLLCLEILRRGWKLLVNTSAKTWHLRNSEGGIRDHNAHPEYWKNDNDIFRRKLQSFGFAKNLEGKKLIICNHGIGDTIVFLKIMPELIKKYANLVIGTYYPFLFKDFPQVQLIHTFTANDILGDRMADFHNPYRYLLAQKDLGRKIDLLTAFKEMFLENRL